jgi:hypothetical protein
VRKGLFRFLQAYDGIDYLWIDQLCIDQSNILERNHQVGLMASIYSQSRSVLIWLGKLRSRPKSPIIFNNTNNPEALANILQHNYFRRLWIVQEVLLARHMDVLCTHASVGNIWVSWEAMCNVARHSMVILEQLNVPRIPLLLLKEFGTGFRRSLKETLAMFSGAYCQDPRDRVYGLMGLVEEGQRLTIDYAKPLQGILLDVMQALYTKHGEIDSQSYDYTLGNLSMALGIMSESLCAFLKELWRLDLFEPTEQHIEFFSRHRSGEITAMGYLFEAPNWSSIVEIRELVSYEDSEGTHVGLRDKLYMYCVMRDVHRLHGFTTTKDCWWYKMGGNTYEIYGLISTELVPEASGSPPYYCRKKICT